MKDYYRILEIDKNATAQEIRKAYLRLAQKYHPDKSGYERAGELFNHINEAYTHLSDPQKRVAYDRTLNSGKNSASYRSPVVDPKRRRRWYQGSYEYQPTHKRSRRPKRRSADYSWLIPYLTYVRLTFWIGGFIAILTCMDGIMPAKRSQENVVKVAAGFVMRNGVKILKDYDVVYTKQGSQLKVHPKQGLILENTDRIDVLRSGFFSRPYKIIIPHYPRPIDCGKPTSISIPISFFLFLASFIGLIMKDKPPENVFSTGVMAAILILIDLYLIWP